MATHTIHEEKDCFYFVTFTCYKWLPLIERTQLYDYLSLWTTRLMERGVYISGYVFMPNHIHLLVFISEESKGINHVLGEAKRFMAYEIIKRLKSNHNNKLLKILSEGVAQNDKAKGQKYRVFIASFDAKLVLGVKGINSVLDYIHHNPVSGKWSLVDDFVDYEHSSAYFYECGKERKIKVRHFGEYV